MATKTFYIRNTVAWDSVHGHAQDGGLTPTTARIVTGWTVGNNAINTYALMVYGSEVARTTFNATVQPAGAPGTTDCWRSTNKLKGSFAAGSWAFAVALRSATAAYTGRCQIKVRVWKSSSPTGSSPTELTASAQTIGPTAANLSTTVSVNITGTWSAPIVTLNDEYLFFQMACQVTAAGGGTTQDAVFVTDATNSKITSTNWVPDKSMPVSNAVDTFGTPPNSKNIITGDQGSRPLLQKDLNPNKAGDLFTVVYCGDATTADRYYILASANLGSTWTFYAASNSEPNPPGGGVGTGIAAGTAVCQDTVNYKVHQTFTDNNDSTILYNRFILAYDAAGHINGWSWDAERQVGPFDTTGSPDSMVKSDVQEVVDGSGNHRLMIVGIEQPSGIEISRVVAAVTTVAAGLAPTSAAHWVKITDGSAGYDVLGAWQTDASTDAAAMVNFTNVTGMMTQHTTDLSWCRIPANGDVHIWFGPYYYNDAGATTGTLYRWRFTQSGTSWAVDNSAKGVVVVTDNGTIRPTMGRSVATTNYAWMTYGDPVNGLVIQRIDTSGTSSTSAIPRPDTTASQYWYSALSVDPTETKAWIMYAGFDSGGGEVYDRNGYYNGTSWIIYDDTWIWAQNGWTGAVNWNSLINLTNGMAIFAYGLDTYSLATQKYHLHTFYTPMYFDLRPIVINQSVKRASFF